MGYNGYTEKKKASNEKYLAKFQEIRIRTLPEEKRIIEENAKKEGKSVNQYIKDKIL
jgi:predicted HicB family RNase H-like nuclease